MVSLRVLTIASDDEGCLIDDGLSFVLRVSDQAPHLEYFAIPYLDYAVKRVGGEWVNCDETEFPSFPY